MKLPLQSLSGANSAAPETVVETTREFGGARPRSLHLKSDGSYAADQCPVNCQAE